MYAVVSTGGKQYRVEEGQTLDVERLGPPDTEVSLTPVLLVDGTAAGADSLTLTALRNLRATEVRIAGGPGAVSDGVASSLTGAAFTVKRYAGTDRYGTSIALNRAAFAIHSAVHQARPDLNAAAHTHSTFGRAFSTLGRLLSPITQDSCAFYGDHSLFDDYTGVVLDIEEGKRIAHALDDNKAVILRNHGLLTVGRSVDEAVWWFITMERTCQAQLLAQAAGPLVPIDPEMATVTAGQVGSPMSGWLSLQPLYDVIVRRQPDLLD